VPIQKHSGKTGVDSKDHSEPEEQQKKSLENGK
jgi:hypothetical protein